MKQWYTFYALKSDAAGLIEDLEKDIDTSGTKLKQVASEMPFPSVFAYVPWMHHVLIVQKCKTIEEALFLLSVQLRKD